MLVVFYFMILNLSFYCCQAIKSSTSATSTIPSSDSPLEKGDCWRLFLKIFCIFMKYFFFNNLLVASVCCCLSMECTFKVCLLLCAYSCSRVCACVCCAPQALASAATFNYFTYIYCQSLCALFLLLFVQIEII